jgi:beta-lactam-binding protein with PASTA domain
VPPALALLVAFVAAMLLLRREPEVPKLEGDTVAEATVVLEKHHLELGRVTHADAPKGVAVGEIIGQQPAAGDNVDKGEPVNITLAAPAETGIVPPVNGSTLADAAAALTGAHFGYSPPPARAGNDWVVIRQDPTPGTRLALGKQVTLAVAQPTPAATPTATATATATAKPTSTATATPTATAGAKSSKAAAKAGGAASGTVTAKVASRPALPQDLVFAGATTGQLYRWAHGDAKAVRLTSPKYRFETPTRIDDGLVAVEVAGAERQLVQISADGKTVAAIAQGDYHRPVYSSARGLLAVIAADGDGDAGSLCTLEPQDADPPACAAGRRVGRPAWAPNGRSLLALAAGRDGTYDEVLAYTASGGDPDGWEPAPGYRATGIQSAVWVGNDRVAVLLGGAQAHLRLLALQPDGSFKDLKDFPALTGCELAAAGHFAVLRRGNCASGDGAMILLDVDRAQPRLRGLTSGVNPAWAG